MANLLKGHCGLNFNTNSFRGKLNDMLLGFGAFDIKEAESGAKLLSKILKEDDKELKSWGYPASSHHSEINSE